MNICDILCGTTIIAHNFLYNDLHTEHHIVLIHLTKYPTKLALSTEHGSILYLYLTIPQWDWACDDGGCACACVLVRAGDRGWDESGERDPGFDSGSGSGSGTFGGNEGGGGCGPCWSRLTNLDSSYVSPIS